MKNSEKYHPPELLDPEQLNDIRRMFATPEVIPAKDVSISFGPPDRENLKKFLVDERASSPCALIRASIASSRRERLARRRGWTHF